jgi:hypothetical protein
LSKVLFVTVMGGLVVLLSWIPTLAAGVYVDAAGEVAFLTAPHSKALAGRIIRSNGDAADASLLYIDAAFPLKNFSLVEIVIPVISFLDTNKVVTGFGDISIRARMRLYSSPRRILHVTGALRTGTGTDRVWPYSSPSIDLRVGLAYVDTLSVLQYWVAGSGTYVSKAPEDVPEEELHGHFGRVGGGLEFPFASGALNFGFGAMAAFFESGRTRALLLGTFDYRRSQWLTFTLFAHVEGGESDERVSEYAAGGGFRIFY